MSNAASAWRQAAIDDLLLRIGKAVSSGDDELVRVLDEQLQALERQDPDQ